jgi:hypothetical protein
LNETQVEVLNLNNNMKHHEISAVSFNKKKKNNLSHSENKSEMNELNEIHRHLNINNIKFS